jgi:hypothetical protein
MNCPHHISWILPVRRGLHQCFQCWQVVTRKEITPKFEDLTAELQRRWEAHEKEGQPAAAAPAAKSPAPSAPPAATAAVDGDT